MSLFNFLNHHFKTIDTDWEAFVNYFCVVSVAYFIPDEIWTEVFMNMMCIRWATIRDAVLAISLFVGQIQNKYTAWLYHS